MWEILPSITSPISLIALALVIVFAVKRAKVNADIKKLQDLDSDDKAKVLPILEEKYSIITDDLTKQQRYSLAKSQLSHLAKKSRDRLLFSCFVAIIFLIAFFISINHSKNNGTVNNTIDSSVNSVFDSPISALRYNIVDSSESISLLFTSELLSRRDTIKITSEITLDDLMNDIIRNYRLTEIVKRRHHNVDIIYWTLVHENRSISIEDMKKQISALRWKSFDKISIDYKILTNDAPTSPNPNSIKTDTV